MKKFVFVLVCLLLMGVLPVFAGGQKQDGTTTLEFWTIPELPNNQMVELFYQKKQSTTKINIVTIPGDDMMQLIQAAVSSGTSVDIFYTDLGMHRAEALLDADLIYFLDDAAKKYGWDKKLTPFSIAEATHRGKLCAVPNETEFIAMWYNKKIFNQLGVKIPKSWNELVAIVNKASAAGIKPFAFGDLEKTPAHHRIGLAYHWNPKGRLGLEPAVFGNVPLDSPDLIKGIETLMLLDGVYWPDAVQLARTEAIAAFLEGRAAMMHNGTWMVGDIKDIGNAEDFGVFIPPIPGTSTLSTIAGAGGGFYINTTCKDKAAALDFLDIAISEESQRYHVQYGFLPVIDLDVMSVPGASPLAKEILTVMNESLDNMGFYIHHFISTDMTKWLRDGYQALLMKQITAAEFAQRMQELKIQAKKDGFTL
jgi:raffinose/stachyose/melibiose transport system substrate-binding protein